MFFRNVLTVELGFAHAIHPRRKQRFQRPQFGIFPDGSVNFGQRGPDACLVSLTRSNVERRQTPDIFTSLTVPGWRQR
jgi:hypothetical protein